MRPRHQVSGARTNLSQKVYYNIILYYVKPTRIRLHLAGHKLLSLSCSDGKLLVFGGIVKTPTKSAVLPRRTWLWVLGEIERTNNLPGDCGRLLASSSAGSRTTEDDAVGLPYQILKIRIFTGADVVMLQGIVQR